MATKSKKLNGRQKAAALLVSLGPQLSSSILKLFDEEHLEAVIVEIFNLERIEPDVKMKILEEAYHRATAEEYMDAGGLDYARDLLQRALGPQKGSEILDKIAGQRPNPFDFVREIDPGQVMSFLQGEHPQTISLVLSHLSPGMAAAILSGLEADLQSEVATRVAAMNRTAPEVIDAVEKSLKRKLSTVMNQEFSTVGGLDFLVKILTQVDRATEKGILQSLDPNLAEEVKKQMFVFEDIAKLDDRSLQRVLRDVNSQELSLALKGTNEEVRRRVFANMSSRAAQILKEDMETSGPVRLKAVEEAQQSIVRLIRRLDEAEEIVLSRGSADEVLV